MGKAEMTSNASPIPAEPGAFSLEPLKGAGRLLKRQDAKTPKLQLGSWPDEEHRSPQLHPGLSGLSSWRRGVLAFHLCLGAGSMA